MIFIGDHFVGPTSRGALQIDFIDHVSFVSCATAYVGFKYKNVSFDYLASQLLATRHKFDLSLFPR